MSKWKDTLARYSPRAGVIVAVALLAAAAGWMLRGPAGPAPGDRNEPEVEIVEGEAPAGNVTYTCSMHPSIRQDAPGQCPICGMDLIPATEGDVAEGPRTLSMTENAAALAEIRTTPVERRQVMPRVRMVGKVSYDETRVSQITAWVGGRIDELFVDFTGIRVEKGDHMARIYSPELLAAQEELIQAVRNLEETEGAEVEMLRERSRATLQAAREKLRLLGLKKEQIDEVVESRQANEHVTIYSPMGGVVIDRHATEGMYVDTGTRLYTVADLTHLWVQMDAYETDLAWLGYGRRVNITTAAYPGEVFEGWIAFISPVVDDRTRTVKVRVNVENPRGRLKPDMFVRAVTTDQRLDAAGKWVCPMHPEVVADEPSDCTICGMDLVRAESLGYAEPDVPQEPRLVVPASAVLWTGERSVVYVKVPHTEKPTFEGREIVLGPRAGDYYMVAEGLREDEQVVVNGNFKIDSALQIRAKTSMMSPGEEGEMAEHAHEHRVPEEPALEAPEEFREQIAGLWEAYQPVRQALAEDDSAAAAERARTMRRALGQVDMMLLKGDAHQAWMGQMETMGEALKKIAAAPDDLKAQRTAFEHVSNALTQSVRRFGVEGAGPIYRLMCPMAFGDRAAYWLQADRAVRNPYWGPAMLECGEVTDTLIESQEDAGE